MSERPFMQLYVSDFVGSTLPLSAEEIGAYILLLCGAELSGGRLPNDPAKLARVARIPIGRWSEVWGSIQRYFTVRIDSVTPWQLEKWERDERRINGRSGLPIAVRYAIIERDGERCAYCGTGDGPFHIDHVHPVALGGTDDPENLVVACRSCNLSKGAKTIEEWRQ